MAQGYRVTDMVCAGYIGYTPEILEVSILILFSDVLLNACSVVCHWRCPTCRPGDSCDDILRSKVAPFSSHVFVEQCNMEVELGAFL